MIAVTRRALGPPPKFLPTPAEIATECAKIQHGWSKQDRLKRRHAMPNASAEEIEELTEQVGWHAPTIDTSALSRSECHLGSQA